jgi:hypothetical protein
MGKSLTDLNLNDDPIQPTPSTTTPTSSSEVRRFLDDIDELRGSHQYGWADDTLRDIARTVELSGRVTEGQRKAIANIEAGAMRKARRRWEGFGGRFR